MDRGRSDGEGAARAVSKRLTGVEARLRAARRRHRRVVFRAGATLALMGALATYVVVVLMPTPPHASWLAPALVFALGTLASGVVALRTTPSLIELARRADRRFGLREVVSTALEVDGEPPSTWAHRVHADRLLRQAAAVEEAIEVRELIPNRLSLGHFTMLALLAGIALVVPRLQPPFTSPPVVTTTVAPLDEAERTQAREALEELADSVESEAERLEDPYLRALTRATTELASRMADETASPARLAMETEALLQHLSEALERDVQVHLTSPPNLASGSDTDGDASARSDVADLTAGIADVVDAIAQAAEDRAMTGFYFDNMVTAAEQRAAAVTVRGEGAGDPAGAAQESTRAPGDAAGEGTQDLFGEAETAPEFEDATAVDLPQDTVSDGARVRTLGTPDDEASQDVVARGGGAADPGTEDAFLVLPPGAGADARREAGGWRASVLTPSARALASRLYAPVAESER